MNELINELKDTLELATDYEKDGKHKNTFYFKGQLSVAKSIVSYWNNPPHGKNFYSSYSERGIEKSIYHLRNSMINPF